MLLQIETKVKYNASNLLTFKGAMVQLKLSKVKKTLIRKFLPMKYQFMRYPGGLCKAVTLSYDDGAPADARLCETLNRYGIKCTFNLVASSVENEWGLTKEFIRNEMLGKGHEVATHGEFHRGLDVARSIEGIQDTLNCRLSLEKEFDIIIRGMAFPDRTVNKNRVPIAYERIRSFLQELDIAYARTTGGDNDSFELPEDFHNWVPTAHHKNPKLMEYIDSFLNMNVNAQYIAQRTPRLFYLWGHAFEFENNKNWDLLETICEKLSGNPEIYYATNIELYDYITAYRSLIYSADGKTIYNPTLKTLWFDRDGVLCTIESGETKTF